MPMGRQMIDYRLLHVRLPEVVNTQAAHRTMTVPTVLHVLIDFMASALPNCFVCVSTAIRVKNALRDGFIFGASSSPQASLVLIGG